MSETGAAGRRAGLRTEEGCGWKEAQAEAWLDQSGLGQDRARVQTVPFKREPKTPDSKTDSTAWKESQVRLVQCSG